MIANNHVSELWDIMEAEDQMGIGKRLYDSKLPFHIFATYTSGDRFYGIGFTFSNDIKVDTAPFETLKEIRVTLYNDSTYVNNKFMVIELTNPGFRDTFSQLAENLINAVKDQRSEKEMVRSVINQLERWRNLFDKTGSNGLSPARQQGLYGELTFLEKLLRKKVFTASKALDFWVGTDAALRDFQGSGWAVEVKTTASNNPQRVTINGERQLDESLLSELYVYHCSVEVSKHNGDSLPIKIDKLRNLLKDDAPALSTLNEKLILAGYFDEHADLYLHHCFKVRGESAYSISGDFPRIRENELRPGVCDVQYSIVLSMCDNYRVHEGDLFKAIVRYE